jgi:hypothetical protein
MEVTHFVASAVPGTQTLLSLDVAPGNSAPADEQMQTGGCAVGFQLSNLCLLGTAGSENEYFSCFIRRIYPTLLLL